MPPGASHQSPGYKGLQQPPWDDLWRPFSSSSGAIIRVGLLHGGTVETAKLRQQLNCSHDYCGVCMETLQLNTHCQPQQITLPWDAAARKLWGRGLSSWASYPLTHPQAIKTSFQLGGLHPISMAWPSFIHLFYLLAPTLGQHHSNTMANPFHMSSQHLPVRIPSSFFLRTHQPRVLYPKDSLPNSGDPRAWLTPPTVF